MSLEGVTDKKLILFGGKGGVGKTTCASTTALHLAKSGKKTLIFSTDPAHSLSDCFSQKIGDGITKITGVEDLYALEIDAEKATAEFKGKYKFELRQIFEQGSGVKYMGENLIEEAFSLPIPGIDEVIGMKVVMDIMERKEYERYVLDTAPTAHALRLISVPDLLKKWLQFAYKLGAEERYMAMRFSGGKYVTKSDGFIVTMQKAVENLKRLLTDSERTEFVVVTIPTSLAISETEKLVKALGEHGIPLKHLVINNVFPSYETSDFARHRREEEERYIRRIRDTFGKFEITEIPLQANEVVGMEKLSAFDKMLFR